MANDVESIFIQLTCHLYIFSMKYLFMYFANF